MKAICGTSERRLSTRLVFSSRRPAGAIFTHASSRVSRITGFADSDADVSALVLGGREREHLWLAARGGRPLRGVLCVSFTESRQKKTRSLAHRDKQSVGRRTSAEEEMR
ncbi:hypothetical protein EYF80_010298 [Liparis tanakae]|uniref:Uncharacterized protein n=1 Tax=Liparis tanakae TaxID=230148 RepID=A0A4Z2IPS5_9TELE|nr:hypothetical protein EYF80_010298 [Liparis tanakae]